MERSHFEIGEAKVTVTSVLIKGSHFEIAGRPIDFNFYGEFAIEIAEIKVIVALILLEGSHFDIAEANVPLPSIRIKRSHLISFKQRVPLISVLRRSAGPKTFSTDF